MTIVYRYTDSSFTEGGKGFKHWDYPAMTFHKMQASVQRYQGGIGSIFKIENV
jgi:hypothetical protein